MAITSFKASLDTSIEFRDYLSQDREQRIIGEKVAVTMSEWIRMTPEPRVGILSFESFPFQAPESRSTAGEGLPGLYGQEVADAESVVVMKSTQIGVSAWAWRWAARQCDQFADRCLYIFPTDKHVTEFGRDRIDTSVEESPYLQSRMPNGYVNNQHQKRIGDGFLFLRGARQNLKDQRAAGAQSVAAQSIVFDEYDDLDQRTVAQLERRLSGAAQSGSVAKVRRVGVPTVPGYGIAQAFARSDRRRWYVHCQECGKEQTVEWSSVRWRTQYGKDEVCRAGHDLYTDEEDVEEAWRACSECEAVLDVSNGRWLAENPGARTIGYHASRLIVPRVDLRNIVRNSRQTTPHEVEAFHQNDLGVPFSSDASGLTEERIRDIIRDTGVEMQDGPRHFYPVTMGVDVASERNIHVRISEHREDGKRYPLYVGEVPDFAEVERLIERYRPQDNMMVVAIDSMPERRLAKQVAGRFPGLVVLAQYNELTDAKPILYNPVDNIVSVNRTDAIDAMLDGIRHGRHLLPADAPRFYVEQMAALKRRLVRDSKGRPHYKYITAGSHGDDFAHAETYDLVAKELLALKVAEASWPEENEEVVVGHVDDVRLTGGDDYNPGFA